MSRHHGARVSAFSSVILILATGAACTCAVDVATFDRPLVDHRSVPGHPYYGKEPLLICRWIASLVNGTDLSDPIRIDDTNEETIR